MSTGRAHWEILLRARAIENQVYLIAPNQSGAHSDKLSTYGHSAVIDPWGEPLAMLGHENEGVAIAQVDLDHMREIRTRVPALKHRVIFSSRE
jgi:nitrilase